MLFGSYEFIFLFFPLVITGYFALSKFASMKIQHSFLVIASLFFYAYFKISFLPIIVSSIIVNYGIAMILTKPLKPQKNKPFFKKFLLIIGILFNIGLLGYYKYYDFVVNNVNRVFDTNFVLRNIILPLGISFFTFQQLSFLISLYKKEEKVENFIDYCLFVSFFPQLIAGPIVLYSEMMPQFKDSKRRTFNFDNFTNGLYCFMYGLFKKLVIADTLSLYVTNGYIAGELPIAAAWITTLSYTFQIYFDFSGYSDMAIGIAKMFNIDIPINFNNPYRSASVTEFWQRWHITLGRALRNYIYIPLGGNRKGLARTCINVGITFLISGIWHGAAWTFVLWGGLIGLVMIFERIFKKALEKIPHIIRVITTFFVTNLFWILFRSESFTAAKKMLKSLFDIKSFDILSISSITSDGILDFAEPEKTIFMPIILIILCAIIVFFCKNTMERSREFECNAKTMTVTAALFVVCIIHLPRLSTFIYFNF